MACYQHYCLKIPFLDTAQVGVINKEFPSDILSQELIIM